jgi:hypothetical protein
MVSQNSSDYTNDELLKRIVELEAHVGSFGRAFDNQSSNYSTLLNHHTGEIKKLQDDFDKLVEKTRCCNVCHDYAIQHGIIPPCDPGEKNLLNIAPVASLFETSIKKPECYFCGAVDGQLFSFRYVVGKHICPNCFDKFILAQKR